MFKSNEESKYDEDECSNRISDPKQVSNSDYYSRNRFNGVGNECHDGIAQSSTVENEAPEEPPVEDRGHVPEALLWGLYSVCTRSSLSDRNRGITNLAAASGEALSIIRILESIDVEEVSKDAIHDKAARSKTKRKLAFFLRCFGRHFSYFIVQF